MKRTNKALTIIIITLVYSIPILVVIYRINIIKTNKSYEPGVTIRFPKTWKIKENKSYNSDDTCKVLANMTTRNIDRIKEELIEYEIEYNEKMVNDINMHYGSTETENQIIYAYIFKHPTIEKNYYLIYTQDKNTQAEDCSQFLNEIEERIVIDY